MPHEEKIQPLGGGASPVPLPTAEQKLNTNIEILKMDE